MKAFSITITSTDWSLLRQALLSGDGNESAAVLLCGAAETDVERRLLVREFKQVPPAQYLERQPFRLKISPRFYNTVIDDCLRSRLSPVVVHSHPASTEASYSQSDDYGESRLLPVLQSLLPESTPASLIVTPANVAGRRFLEKCFMSINSLRIAGVPSMTIAFESLSEGTVRKQSPQFNRQVLAFGVEGQRILQSLKIAIVGVGGIGSLVAEQLARAGVCDLILVDPDRVELSNVSRLFGATQDEVGQLKVDVVGAHVRGLGVSKLEMLADSALRQDVLFRLRDRDVVLGCVDNDRTRGILNRFSHQYLIPFVDLGVRLDGRGGKIKAAAGRASVIGSGLAACRT